MNVYETVRGLGQIMNSVYETVKSLTDEDMDNIQRRALVSIRLATERINEDDSRLSSMLVRRWIREIEDLVEVLRLRRRPEDGETIQVIEDAIKAFDIRFESLG